MKLIYAIIAITLAGCASQTPYIKTDFPKASPILLEQCKPLLLVKDNPTLSELTVVVVENYNKYHECATKQSGWIMWYNQQSNIYK